MKDTKDLLTISSFSGATQVSVDIDNEKDLIKIAHCLLKVFAETPALIDIMQEIVNLAAENDSVRESLESNVVRVPNFNDLLKN